MREEKNKAFEIVATILSGMPEDKEIKGRAYDVVYNLIKNEQNPLILEGVINDRFLGDSKNLFSAMENLISKGLIKQDNGGFIFCQDEYFKDYENVMSYEPALSREDKLYLKGLGKKLADCL